jgi:DNA-binding response OmpR family regulator
MERQSASDQPGQRGMGHVLVLCSNPAMRINLVDSLKGIGYQVTQTTQSAQTLVQLTDVPYDVLVLSLDSVQSEVVSFMQAVKKLQPSLQLVLLTASPSLRTAIAAVRIGAADYLVTPVETSVIVDAVQRSLRTLAATRSPDVSVARNLDMLSSDGSNGSYYGGTEAPPVIAIPPVQLDCNYRKAILYDDPARTIDLSRGETAILASLMALHDQPIRPEQIARAAWKYNLDPFEAGELVRPYIFRLRRKLEEHPEVPTIILTVRGSGYLFASTQDHPS